MKSSQMRALAHKTLLFLILLSMLLPAMPGATAYAQDEGSGDSVPAEAVVDLPAVEGVEAAVVDEVNETPTTIVASGADSYAAPSPGVYWMTEGYCAPEPPSAAAVEGDETASSPEQAALLAAVAPAEVDAATDFLIRRTTISGYDERTLQRKVDNSGPPDYYCPNQYKVNSNMVADQAHVYWVDATGLVRVPVTANESDTPQLVDSTWRSNRRAELKMIGNRIFGTFNGDPSGSGPISQPGFSSLDVYDTSTGASDGIVFNLGSNADFNSPFYDGTYVFYKRGNALHRVNLDGTGDTQIAPNVGVYYSDARRGQLCQIGQPCPQTHYLFYVVYGSGNATIYRRNFVDGSTTAVQTRSDRAIHGVIVSNMPSTIVLGQRRLFWVESVYVPDFPGSFTGTRTYSLMRASLGANASISNLYNVAYNTSSFKELKSLYSNGEFLLWNDTGAIRRLPLDAAALPQTNVRVTGIEITQAIQDDGNSTRLVQGRQTWVRVFVQSDGGAVPNVTMTLSSSEGGGNIYPSGNPFLTVKPSPSRNALGDSYLFLLPSAWVDQPNLQLFAHLNPQKMPFEPSYADNEYNSSMFTLSTAHPMEIVLYPASYSWQSGSNPATFYDRPTTVEHFDRIMRTYPLAEGGLTMRVRTMTGGQALGSRVNQSHADCQAMPAKSRSLCAAEWLYAQMFMSFIFPGVFNGELSMYHYGLIDDGLMFPRGRVLEVGLPLGAGPGSNDGSTDFGYYTAHEVAHELNRNHPTPNGDDASTSAVEGCGHSRSDNAFPYANGFIGFGDGSIRAFDRAQPTSSGSQVALYTDSQAYDVMTYCGNAQMRWPSPYTWEGMYTWLRDHDAASAVTAASSVGGEVLALVGSLHGDVLTVLAVGRAPSGSEIGATSGAPWILRQRDSANALLSSHNFTLEDEGEGALFSLVVPFAPTATRLEIVDPESAIRWSRAVSPAAPVVTNLALAAAATPVSGTVTLNWEASDADGDPLTYDILYSVDSGVSWQPITFDVTAKSVAIDTNLLPGGDARFRVVASDGVNAAQEDSPLYAVTRKGPQVEILMPTLGRHFNWRETVPLSVYALDLADGTLDGASIEWSHQDGPLGTGAYYATASLPTGENVITVKATNSAGYWTSKSITIYVDDALQGPAATLVAVPASLNFQVPEGATDEQVKALALDYIGASGAINWTAESSVPWLALSTLSGSGVPAALTVTVNPGDLPANQAHQATITFHATPAVGVSHTVEVPVTMAIGNSTFSAVVATPDGPKTWLPLVGR